MRNLIVRSLFALAPFVGLALTTPLDNADPLPSELAAAKMVATPDDIARRPDVVEVDDGSEIAACALRAGLKSVPVIGAESPAAIEWNKLQRRIKHDGWSDALRARFVVFFKKLAR